MLKQDGSDDEQHVVPEGPRSQASAGAVTRLDLQVRQTVEDLRMKLENLRLFLSWRKDRGI
jgi:hypothetical protein